MEFSSSLDGFNLHKYRILFKPQFTGTSPSHSTPESLYFGYGFQRRKVLLFFIAIALLISLPFFKPRRGPDFFACAVRQAHGPELCRRTHGPEQSRRAALRSVPPPEGAGSQFRPAQTGWTFSNSLREIGLQDSLSTRVFGLERQWITKEDVYAGLTSSVHPEMAIFHNFWMDTDYQHEDLENHASFSI